jgi:two-component system, NarL family, response regulator LiaR
MKRSPIRILIVDDHTIVRKGTRALLTEIEGLDVVGDASDGEEAIALSKKLSPDVILMDLVMPNMDGIEAIARISTEQPEVKILALTSFDTDDKIFPAMKAGALGYLLKDSDPEELIQAIRQVHLGQPSLNPSIALRLIHELNHPGDRELTPDPLTQREDEVLGLVAKGMSNQKIADHLFITEVTVRTHVSNILSKLHLANRVQATLYALRKGLVALEDEEESALDQS